MHPAFRIDRILVALDAEAQAQPALVRGLQLAELGGGTLEAVHAVTLSGQVPLGGSARQVEAAQAQLLARAREHLTELLLPFLREHGAEERLPALLHVQPGHPAEVLLDRLAQADLLILGPHTRRGLFDLGSTARTVLAHAERPIWIQAGEVEPVREVVVATDFSEHGGCAVNYALGIAERLGAKLRVTHCFAPPTFAYAHDGGAASAPYAIAGLRDAAKAELDAFMETTDWRGVPASKLFVEGPPTDAILEAGEEADLLVLGTHGRTGLSRFVMGSVAQSVLKRVTKPVVVVPNRAADWILEPKTNQVDTRVAQRS